jgi:hypothetical protein
VTKPGPSSRSTMFLGFLASERTVSAMNFFDLEINRFVKQRHKTFAQFRRQASVFRTSDTADAARYFRLRGSFAPTNERSVQTWH